MFPSLHEAVISDVLGKVGNDVELAADALLAAQVNSHPRTSEFAGVSHGKVVEPAAH
jgi:hypothetical protein